MTTVSTYYQSSRAYCDFTFSGGSEWPDWDATLIIDLYDSQGILQNHLTTTSSPGLTKGITNLNVKYVYVTGLDISNYTSGLVTAKIYGHVDGISIYPSPTEISAFMVLADPAVPSPATNITVGDYNWVSHWLTDYDGNAKLDAEIEDLECSYWQDIYSDFIIKNLDTECWVNAGNGEYKVLYDREVVKAGSFLSVLKSAEGEFLTDIRVCTATSTVSGTCIVTGQMLDLSGQVLTYPVAIMVENLYNPIRYSSGAVVLPKQTYHSDISGLVTLTLLPGMRLRIGISDLGIVKTITVPNLESADLFELFEQATDELEPY